MTDGCTASARLCLLAGVLGRGPAVDEWRVAPLARAVALRAGRRRVTTRRRPPRRRGCGRAVPCALSTTRPAVSGLRTRARLGRWVRTVPRGGRVLARRRADVHAVASFTCSAYVEYVECRV